MNLGVLAGLAAAALAAGPAIAAPPLWSIDKGHSRVAFTSEVSGQAFTGVFRVWDAVIHFDPKDLAHSDVAATIDIASAVTGSADRDALLPDEDWFWISRFPRAQFVARGFSPAGAGRYVAAGVLSLRGASRPVSLPFSLSLQGPTARMTGEVTLDRRAFGVGQGEWSATDAVPAAVIVRVDLSATRRP